MAETKRLFVAVELPSELRHRLHLLTRELPQDAIKAVEEENIHITLKFIGDVQVEKIKEITERLGKISFSPFRCAVRGVGVFPNQNYIRIVWVGLQNNEMLLLAEEIEQALSGIGKKEDREFVGHITIARVRRKIDVKDFLSKHANESFGDFYVSDFVLMESQLGREGPTYTVIKKFTLEN